MMIGEEEGIDRAVDIRTTMTTMIIIDATEGTAGEDGVAIL